MSTRKKYWVVPNGSQWQVKHEGTLLSTHWLKETAVDEGRRVAKRNTPSQLLIMRKDGTIEKEFTYELDPYPPIG